MRIVLVSYPYLPGLGGVERSVHNLAHFLSRRGNRVVVVTHKDEGFPLSVEKDGDVRVVRIHIPSPFDRDWYRLIRSKLFDGFNFVVLGLLALLFRPQIVHCHLINVDTRYGARLARACGAGLVISMRGGETEHWIGGRVFRREFVARMLQQADRVTAVSRDLIAQGGTLLPGLESKAETIPNPVDPQRLEAIRVARRAPAGGPYILFSGRLEDMKDVACLIRAYHRTFERRPDFALRLLIVGSGSLDDELRRLAAAGAAREKIEFRGRAEYGEMLQLIDHAALLVLPSAFSEGCPNVVLEAMTLGTPVVVSSLPALKELVEDGVTGRVFEMGDADSLSRCIEELADAPAQAARMAAEAKKVVAVRHAPESILSRIERIYDELC